VVCEAKLGAHGVSREGDDAPEHGVIGGCSGVSGMKELEAGGQVGDKSLAVSGLEAPLEFEGAQAL